MDNAHTPLLISSAGSIVDPHSSTAGEPPSQNRAVVAGAVGNMLEWFDFAAYGYFSAIIGQAFFPSSSNYTSLLSAFAVFAAGFFMRPIGGILFGHIGDRYGRKNALVLSAGLMTLSTFSIGCLPTYETAGILAPILLVLLRLGQGLSVGGEYTSSAIFLVEHAPPKRRGLMGSLACVGASGGILMGSLVGLAITLVLPPAEIHDWGWRLPFLLGIGLGSFIYILRRHISEKEDLLQHNVPVSDTHSPLRVALDIDGRAMVRAIIMNLAPAVSFYIVFLYLVTYMHNEGVPQRTAFLINSLAMVVLSVTIPLMGLLSDHFGRKSVLVGLSLGLSVLSWPLFWLIASGEPILIFLGQGCFAILVGGYTGIMPAVLVELFHRRSRCTAMAISYNAAFAFLGGTAPMVAAALVNELHLPTGPGLYMAALSCISLCAIFTMPSFKKVHLLE